MRSYVNHAAVDEVFQPLDFDPDPGRRGETLLKIQDALIDRLVEQYERVCYELKEEGWVIDQIADGMELSRAKVRAYIAGHSRKTGLHNPLFHRKASDVIDISQFIRRREGAGPASPPDPTPSALP
jgi:hypothetical protein